MDIIEHHRFTVSVIGEIPFFLIPTGKNVNIALTLGLAGRLTFEILDDFDSVNIAKLLNSVTCLS